MDHSIKILDFIEENEEKWMEYCETMKINIHKGLEQLANFKLTHDSDINTSNFIREEGVTIITDDFEVKESKIQLYNSYLIKARFNFIKALKTGLQIAKIKLDLKNILITDTIE